MIVMAAGVHDADFLAVVHRADFALEGQVHQFGHGERIHVGAKRHHRPRLPAAQNTDHAGFAHVGLHLETKRPQMLFHQRGRARFLIRQLGVFVNVATPRDHLGHHGRHARFDFGSQRIGGFALRGSG